MVAESISLIIGIVSALLGLISFFAAIVFYINGSRLNRQSEKILSNIDSKVSLIQEHYGKVVDRSFDITEGNILSLSKQVFSQLNLLEDSLMEAIRAKLVSFDSNKTDQASQQLIYFERLKSEVEKIVEERLGKIKESTEKIIRLSGEDYRTDYIEWRFLKALQYGSSDFQTVKEYFRSYCIEMTKNDIYHVASKLDNEGLIEKDLEFVEKAKRANSYIDEPYWRLTESGQRTLRR